MAQRTYLIGLYLVLRTAYKYMSRWQPLILPNITEQQAACFTAALNAIAECLPLFLPAAPTE
jgi:hypothetical protein